MAKTTGLIYHFNAIRLTVKGTGTLQSILYSLNGASFNILVPLVMESSPDEEPIRKANFKKPRTQVEIKTTNIDEVFKLSRILIYRKESATSLPG